MYEESAMDRHEKSDTIDDGTTKRKRKRLEL
jgi:hypothetical protein